MTSSVTISVRALGRRKQLLDDWSIPLPPALEDEGGGAWTLRDLITAVVIESVRAFRQRQEINRFVRVLSQQQIEQQGARGRIDSGGRELDQQVDKQQAVATALEAFEDGLFLVAIDGVEHRDLDAQVFVKPDSRITFIRLVMLAGG